MRKLQAVLKILNVLMINFVMIVHVLANREIVRIIRILSNGGVLQIMIALQTKMAKLSAILLQADVIVSVLKTAIAAQKIHPETLEEHLKTEKEICHPDTCYNQLLVYL